MSGPATAGKGRVCGGGGGVGPDLGTAHPYLCATLASQGCQGAGHHERGKWQRCLSSLQEEEGKCGRGEYKGDRWGRMAPHLTWVPGWVPSTYSLIEQ